MREEIREIERQILLWHRSNATSRRLATIPGFGPIVATALVGSVRDPAVFTSGRDLTFLAELMGIVGTRSADRTTASSDQRCNDRPDT